MYKFKNINSENPSVGTHIEVPANNPTPQVGQQPTPYDYLTLVPVLITALTPLILGLKKNGKNDKKDKKDKNDEQ